MKKHDPAFTVRARSTKQGICLELITKWIKTRVFTFSRRSFLKASLARLRCRVWGVTRRWILGALLFFLPSCIWKTVPKHAQLGAPLDSNTNCTQVWRQSPRNTRLCSIDNKNCPHISQAACKPQRREVQGEIRGKGGEGWGWGANKSPSTK